MVKKLQQDILDGLLLFQSYSRSRSDGDVLASYHGKARQMVPPPCVERVGPLKTSRSLRSNEIDVFLPSSPCLAQYVVQKYTEDHIYDYLLVVAIILIQINMEDEAIKSSRPAWNDQIGMMSFPVT